MKTTTKIIILLAAIVAVFIAVLFFLQNLGKPPSIPNDDEYVAELNQYMSNFKRYKTLEEADAPFGNKIRCAEIFHHEGKISAERCDGFIDGVMKEYMRVFGEKWNEARFKTPWTEADLNDVSARIRNIEAVKHTDGSSACSSYQSELDDLKYITKNYWSAKKFCGSHKFSNLNNAEKTVNSIRTYRIDEYLKNCETLVRGLDDAVESLNSSHFAYLKGLVEALDRCVNAGTYKTLKKSVFECDYLNPAKEAANVYNSNAKKLYGRDKGVSELILRISKLETRANDYYSKSNSGTSSAVAKANYVSGHEYVDLGLSVRWATCNVGASSPSDYGNYYAWGETGTKYEYTASNISYSLKSRTYNIGGDSKVDVASKEWGGIWRMPSKAELDELVSRCKWVWTSQGGHSGYKITGPNGNSIFLPATGYKSNKSTNATGIYGYYWSSTPIGESAYCYVVSNGKPEVDSYLKFQGFSIRPVIK